MKKLKLQENLKNDLLPSKLAKNDPLKCSLGNISLEILVEITIKGCKSSKN